MFLARTETWMRQALGSPAWSAWLAHERGRAVGCCWLQLVAKVPNTVDEAELHAYITNEFVEPDERRRGIGGALLSTAIACAAWAGVDEIMLWRSDGSQALYARHGFVEPARRVMTRQSSSSSVRSSEIVDRDTPASTR